MEEIRSNRGVVILVSGSYGADIEHNSGLPGDFNRRNNSLKGPKKAKNISSKFLPNFEKLCTLKNRSDQKNI